MTEPGAEPMDDDASSKVDKTNGSTRSKRSTPRSTIPTPTGRAKQIEEHDRTKRSAFVELVRSLMFHRK